ncbi:RNA polymerase II C-terminal domain phosphatase-like 3 [Euphorbia lathyris]|uniref:RNA polymerase II C-terminal domain phosphatase-like 3 n=1 Tax=Euphorbia lathyris TaxID=212925 RepID=UPI00331363D0
MGNDDESLKIEDVEEGEISDTASVEEISAEDFNKQEIKVDKESKAKEGRFWTMRDVYKYQMGGRYVSGLYNLAWAQAVQNKPLNELFVEVEPDENSKRSSPSSSVASANSSSNKDEEKKKIDKVVIDDSDDEMEEGELEEGEIDLDSGDKALNSEEINGECSEVESKEKGFEKSVNSIIEALKNLTVIEAEKSFGVVCSKMHNTLESLQEVVQENSFFLKDDLMQLTLNAIQAITSVFRSMNHKLREQNKGIFSRFLSLVNSCVPSLFSPEHIKEIEVMVSSIDLPVVWFRSICDDNEKVILISNNVNNKDNLVFAADKSAPVADLFVNNEPNTSLDASKIALSSLRSRCIQLPLLDLHKDHDADSLPSPTRDVAPPLPVHRVLAPKVTLETEGSRMHLYENEALKAVSSYQQKFSRSSSFVMNDMLPSPTPSEESGGGDGDIGVEVSSSATVGKPKSANPLVLGQTMASTSPAPPHPRPENSSMFGVFPVKSVASTSSVSSIPPRPSAKSRDPRLRFVNSDPNAADQNHHVTPLVNRTPKVELFGGTMSVKKQKSVDDLISDGPLMKRQRSASENSGGVRDVKRLIGVGGWLEDSDMAGTETVYRNQLTENADSDRRRIDNGVACPSTSGGTTSVGISGSPHISTKGSNVVAGGEQVPMTGTNLAFLPDLLKNVDPAMLLSIFKIQQQKLALEAQQKPIDSIRSTTVPLNSNSASAAVPPVTMTPPQSTVVLPRPPGTLKVSSQLGCSDDLGKIRMKPRDPRRVLHNNALQRSGSSASEFKTTVTSTATNMETIDNQNVEKAVRKQSVVPPDISLPFTKSLKNIASIVSVSHAPTTPPVVTQNVSSQAARVVSQNISSQPTPVISQNVSSQAARVVSQNVSSQPTPVISQNVSSQPTPVVSQNVSSQPTRTITSNSDQPAAIGSAVPAAQAGPRPPNPWADFEHLFDGYNDQQKAAIQRERTRRIEEQNKMFAANKLCLVLDLDHTLLNSAKFVEVDTVHDEILRKKEEQDREKPQRHLFRFPHMGMWTKLRPGIWNFLEKASKLFELHLYTMGNKLYATEMAKVLDPSGTLFNGRVISRGDDGDPYDGDERVPKSKDLEGVLGMESAVVIIDDSVRVWPHNRLNLIIVERYIYFPCSRRQFGLPGPSLLEIDHDERPEDGTLACSLSVIERIHKNFFTHSSLDEADVRNILASEQKSILAGCRIVFSRVFPVGEANPHMHPLWQTAEQFGAVCTNQLDEQVTHVVANSLGTDKVNWALSNKKFVVYPGWVEASALLYRRANEQDFSIKS